MVVVQVALTLPTGEPTKISGGVCLRDEGEILRFFRARYGSRSGEGNGDADASSYIGRLEHSVRCAYCLPVLQGLLAFEEVVGNIEVVSRAASARAQFAVALSPSR